MTNKNQRTPETLTWKAPSHVRQAHSTAWYIGFGIVAVGLLAFAIYTKSIITGITFALIIISVYILVTQAPREITYRITKTGIGIDNSLYPYKTIKVFWIVYNPPDIKVLNIETTAYINNKIIIQLGRQDPLEAKLVLSQYLIEDLDREENFSDALARRLKI